jgi:Spy/CpxP family protein refolding chaperone
MKPVLAALLLALAWAAPSAASGGDAPGTPHHPMMTGASAQEHEAMMERMRASQEKLDALVAAMDAAQGPEKVNAVADVVRELVAERKAMTEHMREMHEHMRQSRGKGSASAPGTPAPGDSP